MANPPSLTAPDLSSRIKAFQSVLSQGAGESREAYVARVQTQLAAIEGQLTRDQAVANAVHVDGWFGGTWHIGSANGPKVSKGEVDAAKKELLPADSMVSSTLRGVVERETSANRKLGQTVPQWQQAIDAAKSRADAAMKDLVAGKAGAAEALSTALGEIRDTLRGAGTEAGSDDAAITQLRNGIEAFAPVTADSGWIHPRTEEKNALAAARASNDQLRAEPAAERSMSQTGPATVQPFVVAQLQHDPKFAGRNFNGVNAQIAGWDTLSGPASAASNAAQSFAQTVGSYRGSLTTVANGPSVIAQLDGEVGQTRANYEQATRELQQGQQEYTATARSLQSQRIVAESAATAAAFAASNARNVANDWSDTMDARSAEAQRLANRISTIEETIENLKNSSQGNPTPGGGNPTPGGGNARPGGGTGGNTRPGGGNSTPGGGSDNTQRINELRAELQQTRDQRARVVAQYNDAVDHHNDAVAAFNRAAAASTAASIVVSNIIGQQRQNDAFLADLQRRQGAAGESYNDAKSRRAGAQAEIDAANRTIAAAPQSIPSSANAYNSAAAALETASTKAAVGDDGHKALQAAPVPTLPIDTLRQAISAGDKGSAILGQAGSGVVQATNARASVVSSSRQRLQAQADQIVSTAVSETLK